MAELEVLCLVWSICVIIAILIMGSRALRQKRELIGTLYNRPSIKYVKKRLLVKRVFKEKFLDIKVLSKRLYFREEHIKTKPLLAKPRFDLFDFEQPGGGIRHGIAAILGENIGTPTADLLMEKMSYFYDELMEDEEEKDLVHKAIRFEMKNNCIRNPYDIFGAKLCKLIESAFQDIIDAKESPPTSSYIRFYFPTFNVDFSKCHGWVISKINNFSGGKIFEKLDLTYRELSKHICIGFWISFLVILLVVVISVVLYQYGSTICIYMSCFNLELSLSLSLFFLNILVIAVLRKFIPNDNFYTKFTLTSFVYVVSYVIFATVGLYFYDYFTDIKVFLDFTNSTYLVPFDGFPNYSIMERIKGLLSVEKDDDQKNASEIHTPAIFLGMLLFLTTLITLPSLHCIKNQIDVYLVMNGKLKENRISGSFKKRLHSIGSLKNEEEERHLLWRIIKRNQLNISEAGVESTYQFMTQWAIYFTIKFWIDFYKEISDYKEKSFEELGYSNMNLTIEKYSNAAQNFSSKEINKIEELINFDVLWKSGLISFLSLSYAQVKLNDVQHELSLDLKQWFLYILASMCNTASYGCLLVMLATNVFDFIPLASDWIDMDDEDFPWPSYFMCNKVELILLFMFTMYPLIVQSSKRALKRLCWKKLKHFDDEVQPDILAESADLPECKSFGGGILSGFKFLSNYMSQLTGLFHFQFLQLPTFNFELPNICCIDNYIFTVFK